MHGIYEKCEKHINGNTFNWLVIVLVFLYVCFGTSCFRDNDLHNNGATISGVRDQIEFVGNQQREISERLQRAETSTTSVADSIDRGQERIRTAETAVERIENGIREQRGLIGDCQRIAGEVRAGTATH